VSCMPVVLLYPILHPIPHILDEIEVWRVGRDLDIRYSEEEEVQLRLVGIVWFCVVLLENIAVKNVIVDDKLLY